MLHPSELFNLDSPWRIVGIAVAIGLLRLSYTLWREAPHRGLILELADSLLIAFGLVFLLVKPFVVASFYIPSESMQHTLEIDDRVLVNKFILRLTPPRRGDVIVFNAPPQATLDHKPKDYIKRVIGVPGDEVEVRRFDGVYIKRDGRERKLTEPYVAREFAPDYDLPPVQVPKGSYFVMGDHRNSSNDSHVWGFLDAHRVVGKAMVIFWPPGRMRLVR